jgi:hypothetical protein
MFPQAQGDTRRWTTSVTPTAVKIATGIVLFGFLTSSATLHMSSNPMKTEKANMVARRIAVIPIVSTSPVAVVASEMGGMVPSEPRKQFLRSGQGVDQMPRSKSPKYLILA